MYPGEYPRSRVAVPSGWTRKQNTIVPVTTSLERELRDHQNTLFRSGLRNNYLKEEPQTIQSRVKKAAHAGYQCVKEYNDNTSLHGLKYITEETNFWWERIIWLMVCCLALSGAVALLTPIFKSYLGTPTVTSIFSTAVPIWEIPFPAVTICNINKARKDNVHNVIKQSPWTNYSGKVLERMIDYMAMVGHVAYYPSKYDAALEQVINEQNENVDDLMKSVIQPLDEMVKKCWWIGRQRNCSDLFELRVTDAGYCWSFNSEPMRPNPSDSDASLDTMYDTQAGDVGVPSPRKKPAGGSRRSESETDFIPKVVNGAGPNMGLTVMMDPELDQEFASSGFIDGFRVLVHNPYNFPSVATKSFLANPGKEIFVSVRPVFMDSTIEVQKTSKESRDCRYPEEVKLKFYSYYSYSNCFLECQVESMRRTCGCVPYLYASLRDAKLCNYNGTLCINNNSKKFAAIKPDSNDNLEGLNTSLPNMACKCMPSCEEEAYFPEVSNANFPMYVDDLEDLEGVNEKTLVLLRVFFKDLTFVQYSRNLQFTTTSLIAAFGGLVGLFLGFSFVSAAEMVYFFTIRPFTHWYKNKKKASDQVNPNLPRFR